MTNTPRRLARRLLQAILRTRAGQGAASFGTLFVCLGTAWLLWRTGHLIAVMVAFVLAFFGLCLAWELLPFSEETRARRERRKQVAEDYPSLRLRGCLWPGIGLAIATLLRWDGIRPLSPWDFAISGVFTLIGAVAYAVWIVRHRAKFQGSL